MRRNLFNIVALGVFLANGNLAWGLEKTKVYEVASGSRPAIATDNTQGLYVAYESPVTYNGAKAIRDGNGHVHSVEGTSWTLPGIWFVQSGIGGEEKWSYPETLPVFTASHQPAIAIEKNGAIDIVMTSSTDSATAPADIFFTRSTDGGHTWSKAIDIAATPGESSEPAMAIDSDNSIHVVWSDTSRGEDHRDIFYSYSKDGGKTWGKDPLLPADNISSTSGRSIQPAIAISDDGSIHVAWLDSTPGETHPDIYYSYKTNNVWSEPLNLSHSSRMSSHPGIACGADGKVYVCWSDNSRKEDATDIWCAISTRYGHFARALNISNTPGVAGEPAIAADNAGNVTIVWSDTSNTPDKPDIYCRISTNGASGFSNVINLSHTIAVAKHPTAILAGKAMLATWDETDGAIKQIKLGSMEFKNLAMGPVLNVDPGLNLHASK